MSSQTPLVPVEVRIDGALALSAVEDVSAEVARRVGDLMATLGIPASPGVSVRTGDVRARPSLRLRVADRTCRYSEPLFARAMGSVRAALPTTDRVTAEDLADWSSDDLAGLVGVLTAETIKRTPSALVSGVWMSAYAERLVPAGDRSPVSDGELAGAIGGPVGLGISVADFAQVAALLEQAPGDDVVAAQETLIAGLARDTMDLVVPDDVAATIGVGDIADPDDLLGFVAKGMFDELGVVFPRIVVATPDGLPADTFAIRLNDITGMPHALPAVDEVVVNGTAAALAGQTRDARPVLLPGTDRMGSLVPAERRGELEAEGWTTWDRAGFVVLQLAAAMRAHSAAVINQDRMLAQLDAVEVEWPSVVRAARDELAPARLTALLRRLVLGGVPLRHLPAVLDRIVDLPADALGAERHVMLEDQVRFDARTGPDPGGLDAAESFVRQGVREHIAQRVTATPGVIVAYLLDDRIEQALATEMDQDTEERILGAIRAELAELPGGAAVPVLLTGASTRRALHQLVRSPYPLMAVVAHEELPADAVVQPVARIALQE